MQDCLMVKSEVCRAGSKALEGFHAPFSAAVYEKCLDAGFDFAGLVRSDEFGIDSLFDNDDPIDAAVTAVLENQCEAVLCNDVFGKLRRQAAQHGLVYIHPAYGTVSRYGLIPSVSSMDQVGVLCRGLEDGIKVLNVISGYDHRDGTSQSCHSEGAERLKNLQDSSPLAQNDITLPPAQNDITLPLAQNDITLPLAQTFSILTAAEICNNTNRYDGLNFGYRAENAKNLEDLYQRSRSESFGRDAKLMSLLGCMVLSQEYYESLYDKAMRIRRLIRDHYTRLLEQNPVLALPAAAKGGKFDQLALYAPAVLGGFASLVLSGRQLICKHGDEDKMFEEAR